jgi:hypothetical protein
VKDRPNEPRVCTRLPSNNPLTGASLAGFPKATWPRWFNAVMDASGPRLMTLYSTARAAAAAYADSTGALAGAALAQKAVRAGTNKPAHCRRAL